MLSLCLMLWLIWQPKKNKKERKFDLETVAGFCAYLCQPPLDPFKQRRKTQIAKLRSNEIQGIRKKHWKRIHDKIDVLLSKKWVAQNEPKESIENFFADVENNWNKAILQFFVAIVIYISGFATYWYIARPASLSTSVENGLDTLKDVNVGGWAAMITFWVFVLFYYHCELAANCHELSDLLQWVFVERLRIDPILETVYDTPLYTETDPHDDNDNDNDNDDNDNDKKDGGHTTNAALVDDTSPPVSPKADEENV